MEHPTPAPVNPNRRDRPRLERVLVPLFLGFIALMILADTVPAFRDARDRLLHPAEYGARKACHAAALRAAARPTYARIVAEGEVHATQGAQYVKGVIVGEMGPEGSEVTFQFSCYVDPDGKVVQSQKQTSPVQATQ